MTDPDTQTDLLDAARRVLSTAKLQASTPYNARGPSFEQRTLDDLEAAPSEYEWNDEPPSEPGWYWTRGGNEHSPRPVEIVDTDEGLQISHRSKPTSMPWFLDELNPDREWSSRIPEPTDTE